MPLKLGPLGYHIGAGADERPATRCWLCAVLLQYCINIAVAADIFSNALLGGSSHETVSQRAARARRAGSEPAAIFCAVLTALSRLVGAEGDHCHFALSPGSLSQEIWSWSPDTPNPPLPPDER